MDVNMEEVVKPVSDSDIRAGAGSKVVITIGPSCQDVPTLVKLLEAGVTCARINLSWGTREYHARSLSNLAEAMKQTRRLCSVFVDTVGREVVVRREVEYDETGWPMQKGDTKVDVKQDEIITITTDPTAKPSSKLFPVSFPGFTTMVEVGHQLQIGRFLATGAEGASIFLSVLEKSETTVTCVALNSAVLDGLLTVMTCHSEDEDYEGDFVLPLFTEHDAECIKYLGSRFEVDFVNLSFCNREEDLFLARSFLDSVGMQYTKIVAKIERKSSVRNFEGIAHSADGLIISRGNLGLDFEPEAMALLQKRIISRCNQLGKPVLITRLVDTMVDTPRPTRAEATDVANAVLDGVDGMLLGAETLRGDHPVLTVETVLRLAHAAEQHFDYRSHHEELMGKAYLEEVATRQAYDSVSDFGTNSNSGHSPGHTVHSLHTHRMQPISSSQAIQTPPGLQGNSDEEGSEEGAHGIGTPAANGTLETGTLALEATIGSPAQPYVSEFGSLPLRMTEGSSLQLNRILLTHAPHMNKLESLASSATRVAEKISAGLIIVMVQSGRTVSLVSKYRPPMPIMAVVVPKLKSTKLGWQLEGKYLARQTCLLRGVVPMMAAPMSEESEDLISEAICAAHMQRLVKPNDYVVCLKSVKGSMVVKVVQVNRYGSGLRVMTGPNSSIGHAEEADIIGDDSPFGGWIMPVSPRGPASPLSMARSSVASPKISNSQTA